MLCFKTLWAAYILSIFEIREHEFNVQKTTEVVDSDMYRVGWSISDFSKSVLLLLKD